MLEDNSGGGGGSGDGSGSGSGGGMGSMTVEEMVAAVENGGGVIGGGGEEERGKGGGGDLGNRWPREETLALLKIRADMDLTFRDATTKGPLWGEVSRKLGELGYQRSAKKCKEKFENIFKYHKRTKECRSSRQNGKSYRFCEQLERFDNQPSFSSPLPNASQSQNQSQAAIAAAPISYKPTGACFDTMVPRPIQNPSMEFVTPSTSTTSSSGRESEGNSKRKRKLSDYFEKLMREVLAKQEHLQMQLLEALEKCEKDRMEREEAWRLQQMERIKKEQEYLAQERAIAAARDATVMAFLRKISEQSSVQFPEPPTPMSDKHVDTQQPQTPVPLPRIIGHEELGNNSAGQGDTFDREINRQNNGFSGSYNLATTSRWPKAEVEDLIRLRTNLGMQFQDNGLKGPLWEEISAAMKKLGYNRNAKRCKEKWENINKYYKRVKDSNKRRPESSKTCPYFNLLESLYERKSQRIEPNQEWSGNNLKPEDILMQMMGQQEQQPQQKQSSNEDGGCNNVDQSREGDAMEEDEENDSGGGDGYEIVPNHPPSGTSVEQ
ncbi:OLC1v1008800C1 [Oldenlandia corymbosa var. corymbosa]|uniref:OLC1v1008800C1 n=1 Tax=Oldenlandia corymbosa var. corymbosa TaxID=529605 RepID=A0AAV1DQS5_OLDCO|nr:OLC1v1008800C1 [Oldenlandia corymbosa var. corymbosa]